MKHPPRGRRKVQQARKEALRKAYAARRAAEHAARETEGQARAALALLSSRRAPWPGLIPWLRSLFRRLGRRP